MEKDIDSMEDLQSHLKNFVFVIYVIATVVLSVIFIYHFRPKLPGTQNKLCTHFPQVNKFLELL